MNPNMVTIYHAEVPLNELPHYIKNEQWSIGTTQGYLERYLPHIEGDWNRHALRVRMMATCYVVNGFCVLPISPGSKTPPIAAWQHNSYRSVESVKAAFEGSYRGFNVALLTGPHPDGLPGKLSVGIVDFDVKPDSGVSGLEILDSWEGRGLDTGSYLLQTTPSGGRHLLHKWVPGIETRGAVLPGVDTRGGRLVQNPGEDPKWMPSGYALVYPSVSGDGSQYKWNDSAALREEPMELVELPEWVVAQLIRDVRERQPLGRGNENVDDDSGWKPSVAEVKDALSYIDPATLSYDGWRNVAFGLHDWSDGGEEGWDVLDQWSRSDEARYDPARNRYYWNRCRLDDGSSRVTFGTVVYMARERGMPQRVRTRVAESGKTEIFWDPAKAEETVYTVSEVVGQQRHDMFGNGGRLAIVAGDDEAPTLKEPMFPMIRMVIDRHITWYASVKGKVQALSVTPDQFVRDYHANPHKFGILPELLGISDLPVIVESGHIAQDPGYDAESKVFISGKVRCDIPENPTQEEALHAINELLVPISLYDMDNPSRGAWLSTMLLSVGIMLVPQGRPIYAAIGPQFGLGKSELPKSIEMFTTGGFATATARYQYTDDDDEMGKRVVTAIRNGARLLFFDNVAAGTYVKSDHLATISSEPAYGGRILGSNEDTQTRHRLLVLMSGVNVSPSTDLAARTVTSTILPCKDGKPEDRKFPWSPTEYVKKNRATLAAHALVVLRWWIQNQQKHSAAPPFRFKEWNRYIRSPILALLGDEFDPMHTLRQAQENDPDVESRGRLLKTIYVCFGSSFFKPTDLMKLCSDSGAGELRSKFPTLDKLLRDDSGPDELSDMRDDLKHDIGVLDTRKERSRSGKPWDESGVIGKLIKANSNRPTDGLMLKSEVDSRSRMTFYKVVKV